MTAFEYLSVLLSIVVGLGITHLLSGLGSLLGRAKKTKAYMPHTVWMCNYTLTFVFFWWFQFQWVTAPDWQFGLFLFVVGYAILLYLVAIVLLPTDVPEGFDFRQHYMDIRGRFFGGNLVIAGVDVVDTFTKGLDHVRQLGPVWLSVMTLQVALLIVAARTRREGYHKFLAVFWPILLVGWILYSMRSTSALVTS